MMSGRYIPPGRRGKPENAEGDKPPPFDETESLVSLGDIRAHFWPVSTDENEIPRFSSTTEGKTLHDSAATPGKLAYLILFHGANPRWEADNIIFTKSSLQLLPADLADDKSKAPPAAESEKSDSDPSVDGAVKNGPDESTGGSNAGEIVKVSSESSPETQHGPIAVFKQARKGQGGRSFRFDGWYQIDKLAFLEPGSAELIKMLEQKWTKTDRFGNFKKVERNEESWKASLSHRWAVLKLGKDETAAKERGPPKIERLPDGDPESPKAAKKSVNEMLAELRMGDQKLNGEGS